MDATDLYKHADTVNELLARYGVKFGVYKNNVFNEQLFPFDAIPRVLEHEEFALLEKGLKQRVKALNLFIKDIYSHKQILRDKIIPEEFIYAGSGYLAECDGVMHKLSIINDLEYERRKYNLLHPEAPKQAKSDQGQALTSQEILALQLKELRDMHKLSVITDEEYDRRHYILLHPESTQAASTKDDNESTPQEILALQLKELRDMTEIVGTAMSNPAYVPAGIVVFV